MTTNQAKENILKNFRINYTGDHLSTHDIEVFILNSMEELEIVIKQEIKDWMHKKCKREMGLRLPEVEEYLDKKNI